MARTIEDRHRVHVEGRHRVRRKGHREDKDADVAGAVASKDWDDYIYRAWAIRNLLRLEFLEKRKK